MATINVTNNRLNFDASNRKMFLTYDVVLDSDETYTSIKVVSNAQWCNVKNKTVTAYQTEIELSNNRTLLSRSAIVTITLTTSKGTFETVVTIGQSEFKIYPIWATNIVNIDTQLNYVSYEVRHNGETIYSGKAYVVPNTNYVEIDISKICSSYLNSSLDGKIDNPTDYIELEGVKSFNLYVNGELEASFLYYNSYTYEANPDYTEYNTETYVKLSDPIRTGYDSRQYVVYSFFNVLANNSYGLNSYFSKGYEWSKPVYASLSYKTGYTTFMKVPEGADRVQILDELISIKKTCAKYCLYYQNALGGWDSFLINGNDKRTDKITGHKYTKAINTNTKCFGIKKYLNVIDTSYKLYTDWLTDDEASRMFHLLESTEVYLHNLEDDTIIPVNLTNSSCEFKTFTNNGRKKFNYELNLELAQERIRQ